MLGRVLLLATLAAAFAGCGPGNPLGRKAISGVVTLDGAPVAHGSIDFQPLQQGVASGGVIKDGKFSIAAHEGLPNGKYRVAIYASDPNVGVLPPGGMPGDDVPTPQELIPPEWNVNSQQTIEVSDSSPREFTFAIDSKKKQR